MRCGNTFFSLVENGFILFCIFCPILIEDVWMAGCLMIMKWINHCIGFDKMTETQLQKFCICLTGKSDFQNLNQNVGELKGSIIDCHKAQNQVKLLACFRGLLLVLLKILHFDAGLEISPPLQTLDFTIVTLRFFFFIKFKSACFSWVVVHYLETICCMKL